MFRQRGLLQAKTVNGLREALRVRRAMPRHTRLVVPLLKSACCRRQCVATDQEQAKALLTALP
jgi:hypothetical protein